MEVAPVCHERINTQPGKTCWWGTRRKKWLKKYFHRMKRDMRLLVPCGRAPACVGIAPVAVLAYTTQENGENGHEKIHGLIC